MSAQGNLSGPQFSPFVQRLKAVSNMVPPVTVGSEYRVAVNGDAGKIQAQEHAERLGVIRAYAHSGVPVQHLKGLGEVHVQGVPGEEGNGMYTRTSAHSSDPAEVSKDAGSIDLGGSYAGARRSVSGEYAAVHELGHHVDYRHTGSKSLFGDPGRSEAKAENYADKHAAPHKSLYDENADSSWDTAGQRKVYERTRTRGTMP